MGAFSTQGCPDRGEVSLYTDRASLDHILTVIIVTMTNTAPTVVVAISALSIPESLNTVVL